MKTLLKRIALPGLAVFALAFASCPPQQQQSRSIDLIVVNAMKGPTDEYVKSINVYDLNSNTDLPPNYLASFMNPRSAQRFQIPLPSSTSSVEVHFTYGTASAASAYPKYVVFNYAPGKTDVCTLFTYSGDYADIFDVEFSPAKAAGGESASAVSRRSGG